MLGDCIQARRTNREKVVEKAKVWTQISSLSLGYTKTWTHKNLPYHEENSGGSPFTHKLESEYDFVGLGSCSQPLGWGGGGLPGQPSPHSFALSLSKQGTNEAGLIVAHADMLDTAQGGEWERWWCELDVCWSRQLYQAQQHNTLRPWPELSAQIATTAEPLSSDGWWERWAGREQPDELLCWTACAAVCFYTKGTHTVYTHHSAFTDASIHANIIFVPLKAAYKVHLNANLPFGNWALVAESFSV